MNEPGFAATVAVLWRELGLGTPRPGPDGTVPFAVDGIDLVLREGEDGRHVVVAATVGRLSESRWRQPEQIRLLMRQTLGLLLANRAGLRLSTADGTGPAVVVAEGAAPVSRADVLKALIEDVIQRVEIHRTLLADGPGRGRADSPGAHDRVDSTLIFRL